MLFLNFDAIKKLEERVLKAMFQVHNKDLILSDYTFCNIIKKIISNVSRIVSSIFYFARFYVCVTTTINILQVVLFLTRAHRKDLYTKQIQHLKRLIKEILDLNLSILKLHDKILFTVRRKIVNFDIFFRH